ncbi:uncharacterized protein FPRO_09957 [Fusarium proliferatum ET1]|uniref:Heterokaryon incompatibility domain-containing protein n=1 Tax=Fusarium proliferatum (strain ET1) TaxID=1227346 RepID=A0A1L7VQE2_FUSPR|nr:uncharacterized protein FPRO_09957 [Fusarium proliferatum ET1]CZR42654.1 uncharacterized protein FPRO_09957 [Fusarium proliferatum ET1]
MQLYEYKPLPTASSIRILILHPATDATAPLEVDLVIRDRMELLRDPDNETFEPGEAACLYISAVVDEMLRNLRKDSKERRLWVDAVYLNLKDDQEKSVQVQQMGQIYHMVNKVQIWFGPALPSVPLAFALLRTLIAKYEPTPGEAKYPKAGEILDIAKETCGDYGLESVLDLLNQPWFTRRWTLQEGFLARHAIVRCGSSKISWHWFTEGLRLIHNEAQVLEGLKNDSGALYALNVLETLRKPADLLSLIWKLHESRCSNPSDKIYALLGIAQKLEPFPLHRDVIDRIRDSPEYQAPYQKQFQPQTTRSEKRVYSENVFGSLSEVNPEWSSWVPNWTRTRNEEKGALAQMSETVPASQCIDKDLYYDMIHPLYSSGEIWPVLEEFIYPRPTEYSEGDRHGLVIYGKQHEIVVDICDPWPETNTSEDLVKHLADWILKPLSRSRPQNPYYPVMKTLLLLITGTHFFGYANHGFLRDHKDMARCTQWVRDDRESEEHLHRFLKMAEILYQVVRDSHVNDPEQVMEWKAELDMRYRGHPEQPGDGHEKISCFLEDVSRMMREGNKRLILTLPLQRDLIQSNETHQRIGPSDVRRGDFVTNITICGRIGALLRPREPSSLDDELTFQFIGILWSLEGLQDVYVSPDLEEIIVI